MRLNQVTVAAHDLEASYVFYRSLGLRPIVKSSHYARFVCPDGGSTFSIHASEVAAGDAITVYFECGDLDATLRDIAAKGIVPESAPVAQRWLWREAYLRDPTSNRICLYHAGENRLNPPWRLAADETKPLKSAT